VIIDLDTGDCVNGCPSGECYCDEDDDYLSYLPEGRVLDMLRHPDNRHLY
jgi:hypothetical protein